MVQRLVKKIQRTYFNYQVEQNRHLFQDVNTFVIFIGYPRSGHSLVGSLLDAHPNAIISHELHALKRLHRGYSQEQLFYLIYQNSRDNARKGREETGYSYLVPGQWQGKYTQLKIIGDKKGGKTAELLAAYPQMLNELFRTIKHPIKFIHVLRNPFDNITSMILRGEDTRFDTAIP
ncbi:MAG: hypothetical protein L0154_10980, partial [Chloroflexi bacterium]|nr:hypothetical protein [Chloroflexota bacterium]